MAKEEMKIGEVSKPRFEFRSFGQCFCEAHKRMARLSMPVPEKVWERLSDEIYIISRKNDINNTKIRDGKTRSISSPAKTTSTTPRYATARWTSRPSCRASTASSSGIPS